MTFPERLSCMEPMEMTDTNPSPTAREQALEEALKEIAKAEGPYSQDQLTHASNTIKSMVEIAEAALAITPAPHRQTVDDAREIVSMLKNYCGIGAPSDHQSMQMAAEFIERTFLAAFTQEN